MKNSNQTDMLIYKQKPVYIYTCFKYMHVHLLGRKPSECWYDFFFKCAAFMTMLNMLKIQDVNTCQFYILSNITDSLFCEYSLGWMIKNWNCSEIYYAAHFQKRAAFIYKSL